MAGGDRAWHLVTRGRRGTYGTGLAGSGGVLGSPVTPCKAEAFLRGRRGTWRHPLPFHVAGGYLLWDWAGSGGVLGSPVTPCKAEAFLRGKRGTWRHPPPFTWQAWHLVTSTVVLRGRRGAYVTGLALVTRLDLP